jgi:hypothetical protein
MATKRTTHRSSKGTKLYAVRGKKGEFKDIQTYKRAHGQDVKRKSKKEKGTWPPRRDRALVLRTEPLGGSAIRLRSLAGDSAGQHLIR